MKITISANAGKMSKHGNLPGAVSMTFKRIVIFVLVAFSSAACGSLEHDGRDGFRQSATETGADIQPGVIDLRKQAVLDDLAAQLVDKRAVFVGEVHDRLSHHQNQLRIIRAMYAQNPDLAIGVEYFQQPFQPYLDDYIAGRIDEKEMLVKTEYFKRWQLDYRLLQPIFQFAREKHIPVLALNVPDEIHNKVFRGGMKSLSPQELTQTPGNIEPASEHYLQRLKSIFDSHPQGTDFANFVDGVLLWDASMADTAARYLDAHPQARMVVLAGMVHVMYGDGIPERLNHRLGGEQSALLINGRDFGSFPGIADFLLDTDGQEALPKAGKLGVSIMDASNNVYVSNFVTSSAAQAAGIDVGDQILALNGVKVANMIELKAQMFDKQPGEKVSVEIQRNLAMGMKNELQFEVVLR